MWENFVFLVIFDTCDVVYNWSIRFLFFSGSILDFGLKRKFHEFQENLSWISNLILVTFSASVYDFLTNDSTVIGFLFVVIFEVGSLNLNSKALTYFQIIIFVLLKKALKFSSQKDDIFPEFSSLKFQFSKKLFMVWE